MSEAKGILNRIMNYVQLGYNGPMPEEVFKKHGWHHFRVYDQIRVWAIDDEPLIEDLGKLLKEGPRVIPLIEQAILNARYPARLENCQFLCEAIGRLDGPNAYEVLLSLLTLSSNIHEYQFVRAGAALGLALLGAKKAEGDLKEARERYKAYPLVTACIDEALTTIAKGGLT